MVTSLQVRVRRPCAECGGTAVVLGPHWHAYYNDREQQQLEHAAVQDASAGGRLDARLDAFHAWWAGRIGEGVEIPAEEVPCGECVDGWAEAWVPLEEVALQRWIAGIEVAA